LFRGWPGASPGCVFPREGEFTGPGTTMLQRRFALRDHSSAWILAIVSSADFDAA
jgi:hypothetical protein